MISIDPKTQGITGASKLKKSLRKDQDKDIKFTPGRKMQGASSGESSVGVADIGGMLFLQEIDQYAEDQQNLEEFSKKAFKTLKDALFSNQFVINTPELVAISEEIKLRVEVEIAKIETHQV